MRTIGNVINVYQQDYEVIDKWDDCQSKTTQVGRKSNSDPTNFGWIKFSRKGIENQEGCGNGKFRNQVQDQGLIHSIYIEVNELHENFYLNY